MKDSKVQVVTSLSNAPGYEGEYRVNRKDSKELLPLGFRNRIQELLGEDDWDVSHRGSRIEVSPLNHGRDDQKVLNAIEQAGKEYFGDDFGSAFQDTTDLNR